MSNHNGIYVTHSHTKKIFANMSRQGKYFSGSVTPLFPTMVVQAQEEMGEGSAMPTDPHHTPIITQPLSSQPQRKQKSRRRKRKDTEIPQSSGPTTNVADEAIYKERDDSLERAATPATSLDAEQDKENTKTAQAQEITSLKLRVKRRMHPNMGELKRSNFGSSTEEVVWVIKISSDEVSVVKEVVSAAEETVHTATIIEDEITLAQALAGLKSVTTKGIHLQEPSESITTTTTTTTIPSKDKGKEDTLAREKAQQVEEANIAWDDIQAKIDADYQLAKRLQAQEQQDLIIEEKSTLFQQLLEKRRKFFAAKRAEEKRNMPPTRAQ
ncbi:hypothetical protein Tco_1464585 [Tanacetum coccineum]